MSIKVIHLVKGLTLIEALIAMAIVSILGIGGLSYQYFGAKHFRIAHSELTATRAGQLLIEDWKSNGAKDIINYDAEELGVGFVKPDPGDYSYYTITIDGVKLHSTLSFDDVEIDEDAGVTLRQINVKVQWEDGPGGLSADDPSITLSTYARLDSD
ncbi:MAG: prepilin-type N-terminal cleavage/methylation domain-containing protein [Sedimentisphaerales bacterium]|nr:prepilin-type N-terminal cleavage/methylation domain-containing protein [Sedimentisphaerales bacterium]